MRIAVFCGSREGKDHRYLKFATALGESIALLGHTVVYGGSDVGCMGAVANGAVSKGGEVIGVIPKFLSEFEPAHPGLSKLIVTESMCERKNIIIEESDGFVVLPGGHGTLDEFFEVVTLKVIKQLDKPIVIVNLHGFYDTLLRHISIYMEGDNFTHVNHDKLFKVTETIPETLAAVL
jgi:uncharacterized protein (TIGR00730 family)